MYTHTHTQCTRTIRTDTNTHTQTRVRYCYRQAELGEGDWQQATLVTNAQTHAQHTHTLACNPICRYCYRQAELGVGDCGGLRYIPGMTKVRLSIM